MGYVETMEGMMTPEQQRVTEEELIRLQEENPNYWDDQNENGVDLARLRENLRLTPAERLRRNDRALIFLRQIEKARDPKRLAP